ncbi:MAG: hypothetical protein LBT97_14005 [Planctomycetota bacterium]|jgi:hypothetical protein|nr:hypothetical protein [Planctomycetota bacterium]
MCEPEDSGFDIDQATAERLAAGDEKAWEQVSPGLTGFISNCLQRRYTSPFLRCQIEDIQQDILLKFLRFPKKIWGELASGTFTFPQFLSLVKKMCVNAVADFSGKMRPFPMRSIFDDGDSADGDGKYAEDRIYCKLQAREPPFEYAEEEQRRFIGENVVSLWRSCPGGGGRGNDLFALMLIFGRYFVLKNSVYSPKALVPWNDEDGDRTLVKGKPPAIRDIWEELVRRAEDGGRPVDQYLLAEIAGIRRDALDQKIGRMRKRILAHIEGLTPRPEAASAALALLGLRSGGGGRKKA